VVCGDGEDLGNWVEDKGLKLEVGGTTLLTGDVCARPPQLCMPDRASLEHEHSASSTLVAPLMRQDHVQCTAAIFMCLV
jgi:hypothetical protein